MDNFNANIVSAACNRLPPFCTLINMSGHFDQNVDEAVVVGARAGDRAAQAALYDCFATAVFSMARHLLAKSELAEDVLQDTFVDVLRDLKGYRGEAPIGMWIRKIAVNKCLMHMRSQWHRRRIAFEDLPGGMSVEDWLSEEGNAPQQEIDIQRAFDELPEESRTVLWLHGVEGYTHQEIAALMKITPNTSKSKLARAYKRLHSWAATKRVKKHASDD